MLSSLPDRSLELAELDVISGADGVQFCHPLIALESHPAENVIAWYLGTESGARTVGFRRETCEWDIIDEIGAPYDSADLDALADSLLDWAASFYNSSDIIILSPENPKETLETLLPPDMLNVEDVSHLANLPGIEAIHPLFCLEDTQEIISVLAFEQVDGRQEGLQLASFGFDSGEETWKCVERVTTNGEGEAGVPGDLTIHEWINARYEHSDILAISPDSDAPSFE